MRHNHHWSHFAHRDLIDRSYPNAREALPSPAVDPATATVVQVVTVSLPKTFTNPAVWVTASMVVGDPVGATAAQRTTSAQSQNHSSGKSITSESGLTSDNSKDGPSTAKTISRSSPSSKPSTTITSDTHSIYSSVRVSQASATSTGATASSSSSAMASTSSGMTGGAKAGMALGILIAIAVVLGLVLFLFRRKKQQNRIAHQRLDDEKGATQSNPPVVLSDTATIRTNRTLSTAPRLSLRPVTHFSPDLDEKRKSAGNKLDAVASSTPSNSDSRGFLMASPQPSVSAWERRGPQSHNSDPSNPFGNHAEAVSPPGSPQEKGVPLPTTSVQAPVNESKTEPENIMAPTIPAAVAELAADDNVKPPKTLSQSPPSHQLDNSTGIRPKAFPKPLSISSQVSIAPAMASPAWTESSETPPSPRSASAEGGPAGAQSPNNVHRVQMDFKPSMDDELELRAGQLVRLLHEYDDGWALCTRMDRSQQGVVPRTCLSKHLVKPRPAGPPGARGPPRMRGPPVNPAFVAHPRPLSPASGRESPGPFTNVPRPLSPANGRASPGPYGQPRPMSPSAGRARSNSNASPYPGAPRSMSPGPYGPSYQRPVIPEQGRPRSNSASQVMARRASPPRPSPMNPNVSATSSPELARKPVPGQAL